MNRTLLCCIFCLLYLIGKAQVVSFNAVEQEKLKKLIRTDATVKEHWEGLLATADQAINDTPNPADTILTEGILQGDARKTKTWESLNDMQKVYALSLAYRLTSNQKYMAKCTDFLLAWAERNHPQGNPINDTNLDRIIFAYDLVKQHLTKVVDTKIKFWLKEVADQEIKTFNEATKGRGTKHFNNWNSHRIKEIAEVAWAINDKTLQNWVVNEYKVQIGKNLLPDGSSFDFHERDALHYHIYDVDPLLVAAMIIKRSGALPESPYSYQSASGASLRKAIAWLIPFFTGEKTHAEWVNSKSAFDKKRAANGEKGYIAGTLFRPAEARTSIALASYFEPQLLAIYQTEGKSQSKYPTWQFVLNEIKR